MPVSAKIGGGESMAPEGGKSVAVEVTPRNAYFARACPQRVQLDVLRPSEPLPDSPFLQKLFVAGQEYEEETITAFFDGVEGAVVVDAEDPDAQEWHTLRAVADGARVIAGGRLPVDHEAHRVGEPDLLVRDGDGYLPVDVKSHKSLVAAKEAGSGTALVSDMEALSFEAASIDCDSDPRRHVADLLQLAHYRRLLESAGLASSECNVGGIYGSEGVVVWYDLDRPWLDPPEYVESPPAGPLSAMARYDLEFAHRLEVHLAAEAHADGRDAPLLAEPIACDQCDQCRWRDWCGEQLEQASDLSLISGVSVARRRLYKAHGITDLQHLAALDWTTAELFRCGVDFGDLLDKVEDHPPATLLATVIPNRKKQLEDLTDHGLLTVADIRALDRTVLSLCGAGAANLATQIDLARARIGPAPAYRRRGVARIEVPRGDVEVDVDMESTLDGCYLWGALVTDRRGPSATARYVPFASWDPDIEHGEREAFMEFWTWFTEQRARARAGGATFRAYCYSRSAEEHQMKRIADRLGILDEVGEFLASEDWVDLYEIVRGHLVTGRSLGLKETAPMAGFAWSSDEVGGILAMVNYDTAVDDADPAAQAEAQAWIVRYNEDDVRATAALRDWLDGPANELPSIADADTGAKELEAEVRVLRSS
jgi:predicted RecB family nuclease